MIDDVEIAHAALADALWWLKGFAAAHGDTPIGHEASSMSAKLGDVRIYLDRIADGFVRRIGDEKAVAMSYANFERLFDGLRAGASDADRTDGRQVVEQLLKEYRCEAVEARKTPEIPF